MSLVHAPTPTRPARTPLFARTNTPRFPKVNFKLPVLKKSAPTVSVTNANVARTNTSSPLSVIPLAEVPAASPSSVPFPSSPIPCPSPRKRSTSENGFYSSGEEPQLLAFPGKDSMEPQSARAVSHTDIIRNRSKSCLAASFFHRDANLARKTPAQTDKAATPAQPAKRAATRRESMSAGTPTGKSTRKAKRALADAQLLASVHGTLASLVQTRMNADGVRDECTAQDALLVERIWNTLVDMGYRPIPIETSSAAPSASSSPPAAPDPAREAAERAARRTMTASSTPISLDRAQAVSIMPAGELAVPQLVAVLTMRHRDRSTTRPRAAGKKRADASPSRSPLSTTSFPVSLDNYVPPSSG
ncbi:uncharacterized protein TRAVEDRAFT_64282 [Trametes versicolor FP-101664 SS1]|uniref:uncharacterized protein n=1 Tax=Trametes versicolor (strain FP-101664) TaxID=717944 RepID=UPI000462254E|nr:uncharacterized protein TRAVEDRAFT_64282 [Trametes versicolor FP-101664 SS1]EIW61060.1 hypothetical protein TRAVEDRAFT_64282 [Trametes versicolor FP-101664 SS1]